jgi:hypothetical protein
VIDRPGGQLGARRQSQLAEHVGDVALGRPHADHELIGDLPVGQPARDQRRDLLLARSQE